MTKHSVWVLLCICLAVRTARAADAPITGKWKLIPARSQMTDVMEVHGTGQNKYDFNLGGDTVESLVVDGTDQPASYGTTLSVTAEAPNTWRGVRKDRGRTTIVGIWNLSADGKQLADNFTSYRPNGTTFHLD